jgi:hypothetical protein
MRICGETKAPKGWTCTRELGHEGPCAAVKKPGKWSRFMDGIGSTIGEALFGGNR